jgi:hypothetical protein
LCIDAAKRALVVKSALCIGGVGAAASQKVKIGILKKSSDVVK